MATATATGLVVAMASTRESGGVGDNGNSETYSVSAIQTAPSMLVRVTPLPLNASSGGTPSMRCAVAPDGTGEPKGPAGQWNDVPLPPALVLPPPPLECEPPALEPELPPPALAPPAVCIEPPAPAVAPPAPGAAPPAPGLTPPAPGPVPPPAL